MRGNAITLAELAACLTDAVVTGDPLTVIHDIQYDSRRCAPGTLFVALRGAHFDGRRFVDAAVAAGAVAVVVESDPPGNVPAIRAQDSRAALALVAAEFFAHPSRQMQVIGITGTDGKTTTSYLVDAILRSAGHSTGMIGTVSVRIGEETVDHDTRQTTPESLDVQRYLRRMVDTGVQFAILEATSHGLVLNRLDGVTFAIGAITNITTEHLELHKTVAAYRAAKATLFTRVAQTGGTAIVNLDDPGARSVLPQCDGATVITYGLDNMQASLQATNLSLSIHASEFSLSFDGDTVSINLPMPGKFNVANALCATGICLAAGISLQQIASGLAQAQPAPGRMTRIDAGQDFAVYVDYAHTPESLAKILELIRQLIPGGRIICVSGSAGERDTVKRSLQGAVSQCLADYSIFTSEDPRFEDAEAIIAEIAIGARGAGGIESQTFACITDRREAISVALRKAAAGDVVLLAGKGHERSIIWGNEKRPWDEAAVARALLTEMGFVRP